MDQPFREAVHVPDAPFGDHRASRVTDDLLHGDGDAAVLLPPETDRLDGGIDLSPLARPVVTHLLMPLDHAAFPAVRPHHIRRHRPQQSLDVAGVESRVELGEGPLEVRRDRRITVHPPIIADHPGHRPVRRRTAVTGSNAGRSTTSAPQQRRPARAAAWAPEADDGVEIGLREVCRAGALGKYWRSSRLVFSLVPKTT